MAVVLLCLDLLMAASTECAKSAIDRMLQKTAEVAKAKTKVAAKTKTKAAAKETKRAIVDGEATQLDFRPNPSGAKESDACLTTMLRLFAYFAGLTTLHLHV